MHGLINCRNKRETVLISKSPARFLQPTPRNWKVQIATSHTVVLSSPSGSYRAISDRVGILHNFPFFLPSFVMALFLLGVIGWNYRIWVMNEMYISLSYGLFRICKLWFEIKLLNFLTLFEALLYIFLSTLFIILFPFNFSYLLILITFRLLFGVVISRAKLGKLRLPKTKSTMVIFFVDINIYTFIMNSSWNLWFYLNFTNTIV